MSDTQPSPPPPSTPSAPPRRRGGFFARLFGWLLTLLLTVALSLAAAGALLLYFGYSLQTPADAADARRSAATLEALQQAMETRLVAVDRRSGDQAEVLDELREELDAIGNVRADLEDELAASAQQNATTVADVRASRDQVIAFATAEAGRAALVQELERRSARIERFLARLSDIAEDTALDIGGTALPTATLPPEPTPPPTPTAAPTAAPTATADPTAAPTATADPTAAPTATLEPTPAPTDESEATASVTVSPTRTRTANSTSVPSPSPSGTPAATP